MMQHFLFELTHPSLPATIVLHSKGRLAPPSPDMGGVLWFSARDTPDEVIDLSPAQPSRQALPAELLTPERPVSVRVLLNGHVLFTGSATKWEYDDRQHQCFMRFSPSLAMSCDEMVKRPHKPFHPYWRDIEPRYVGIVEISPHFFTSHVLSCFNKDA
jgi:hypothetical protein